MHRTRMVLGFAGWQTAVIAVAALFLTLGGCSSCGSKGGCGGGCCRGGGTPAGTERPPLTIGDSPTVGAAVGNYGGQRTCPVTGEELGSMGKPIPVSVKGQTVYVCCEGCVAKVQQNPDAFIAKVQAERGTR